MTDDGRAGIVVPADWTRVPLLSAGARAAALREVVSRQTAGTAVSSTLRRDLERTLSEVTADAARAGGQLMAFSTRVIEGRPMAIALTVFRPPTPRTMNEVVDGLLDTSGAVIAHGPSGTTVRQVSTKGSTLSDGPEIEQLVVDYWLDPRDGHGLFHAVFTSPLTDLASELCTLFDAMIATVATAEDITDTVADSEGPLKPGDPESGNARRQTAG